MASTYQIYLFQINFPSPHPHPTQHCVNEIQVCGGLMFFEYRGKQNIKNNRWRHVGTFHVEYAHDVILLSQTLPEFTSVPVLNAEM